MKVGFFMLIPAVFVNGLALSAQDTWSDTINNRQIGEVVIVASRLPLKLQQNPGATSLLLKESLASMPRSIGVEEALRMVPGVRIDNQANGSRVHMSIRGQGILTERGLRGIKVMIDGLPMNDPSGFTPDLYDIDWATVERIEILRGPAASLYGSSSNAGVLNIITESGGEKPFNGKVFGTYGSNGFYKLLAQINGNPGKTSYRISLSDLKGNGYRQHSGFWGKQVSERINWTPDENFRLAQMFYVTQYFNQNAEGLNLSQLNDPTMSNPDAIPCNEYQKTTRITNGVDAEWRLPHNQSLNFSGFLRSTQYMEPGSSAVQRRSMIAPGGSVAYALNHGSEEISNHLTAGVDFQSQIIDEYKLANIKDAGRTEKIGEMDETIMEGTVLLANQSISQYSTGAFLTDRLELSQRLNLLFSLRYDNIKNSLDDKMGLPVSLTGKADYSKATSRLGLSYTPYPHLTLYGNWGLGFLPPATEELASNPESFGGFNKLLVPATSEGEELGFRGSITQVAYFDITSFYLKTKNDFYRYRILPSRPLETFYGNAGSTRRYGIETYLKITPLSSLTLEIAYTYSNFIYLSPDSINGNNLPNSPKHQLSCNLSYQPFKELRIDIGNDLQSSWYIYTNAANRDVSQDGFNLVNASISYQVSISRIHAEFSVSSRNLTGASYIAFTEPDPDGNSYQPGPGREFFAGIKCWF
jgi:iron complex outermembrane recepter protein